MCEILLDNSLLYFFLQSSLICDEYIFNKLKNEPQGYIIIIIYF